MILDDLVRNGDIVSYYRETLDEDGTPVVGGDGMRESDRLTLIFPSGKQLVIDTACSGCMENTSLLFQ